MAPDQLLLLGDPRLSDSARIVGLHISMHAGEWVEFTRDDFRRMLHGGPGKDKVARVLGELELWGYVERKAGGQGHGDSFRFVAPEENSVRETTTLNANSIRETRTLNGAPTTTPTTPPPPTQKSAGGREVPSDRDLDRLVMYLGEHASAVGMMVQSADHPPSWVASVLGKYGPTGTQLRLLEGIPPERRPAVLATALMEFATTRKVFHNRYFDGFMREAADNERNPERGTGNHRSGTGRSAGREAAPVGNGRPPDRFAHLTESGAG